ncbi:recombinase family protein [Agreia sp. PsM10]|uniref:recombinase family protein n=1 Tax=Agreia sp. PsM10 TaxID=3030533 RepID=UPI00263AD9FB|nr:recombinase family protein [Agreia sp. PsM10]MDN4640475.1 recombinase family protein [Agreia sp. PsM10]
MSRTVGYALASTHGENPAPHEAELRGAGADRVFVDCGEHSRTADRPQWLACLDYLREGDTLLVRRLDRLGKSERIIIEMLHDLNRRGVNIKSLTEPMIDTTTPMGRALFGIVAVFAQLRVDTIREETMRGLQIARSKGRVGGRPSVIGPERMAEARRMRAEGRSIAHIAGVLGVGASSVSRAFAKLDQPTSVAAPAERRVFFRDTKPYEAPSALDELRGPAHGVLELPHSVYWGPERTADLETAAGIRKAYQAALREGTAVEQVGLLNRDVLLREWGELALPDRVRVLWESRFPELRASVSA